MTTAASAKRGANPNVLIAGYPKSGNTWLGYLLSYYVNAPYYDTAIEEAVLAGQIAPDSVRYTYNHAGFQGLHERPDQPSTLRAVLKTHALPGAMATSCPRFLERQELAATDPVLLLVRDPRDVAVSLFFYHHFRMPRVRNRWYAKLPYAVRYHLFRLLFFDQLALEVAGRWAEFNTQWLAQNPVLVRYRDLLDDAAAELRRLSDLLGLPFLASYAQEAVAYCAFDSLRRREDGKFRPGAPNERFFRSGKSGGWRSLFSPRMLAAFTDHMGDLPSRLGLL